jgi:2-dehydro-3-deoxygalactonokinase
MRGMTAFIGIDWGTTNRRAALISASGELLAQHVDDVGALSCGGRFPDALAQVLAAFPQAGADVPVVMAGMVGSAIGWQVVPYLRGDTPLDELGRHLAPVLEAPAGRRWAIVPGYSLADADGGVDVMRGEETQLFGALRLLGANAADGYYVLPGTHSKWVRLRQGRIVELRTYLTGELFALLRQHGTLASALQGSKAAVDAADPAFARGVRDAARRPTLSHALFGARARVVTGALAPEAAAAYVSGLLVGAEWADAGVADGPVRVIGAPSLGTLHAAAAAQLGHALEQMDDRAVQLAAWRALANEGHFQ